VETDLLWRESSNNEKYKPIISLVFIKIMKYWDVTLYRIHSFKEKKKKNC
jgi:hypothetical protein